MGRGRQAADAGGVLWVVGVEAEFQNTVFAAHLLIVPIIVAVVEFAEVGMALDKQRLRLRYHPIGLWRDDLLRHPSPLAEAGIKLEAHTGARDTKAVVSAPPDRVEPLV